MNFPDLETCKAIAGEFLESEFIYVMRTRNRLCTFPVVIKTGERVVGDDLVANAPTCEELGEWLYNKGKITGCYVVREGDDRFSVYSVVSYRLLFNPSIKAPNETQARAEAVKLILEQKNA